MNVNTMRIHALICVSLLVGSAHAQPRSERAADETEQATVLPTLTTTLTRTEEPIESLPASITIIDADTLAQSSYQHIEQLLTRVPGVNLQRGSGQEYLPAIRSPVLTGPGACGSFLMAQDGIPLRAAGFCNLNELFDAHYEVASHIDIVRGPASIAHGSNAVNGTINIITHQQADAASRWAIQAGSDDWVRISGRQQFGNAAQGYSLAVTASGDGGFRDQTETEQHKLSVNGHGRVASFLYRYGITATRLNQETAGFLVGTDSYRDRSLIRLNPTPEAYRDANANRIWLTLSDPSDQQSWSVTAYARDNDMAFLQHFLPGDPLENNEHQSIGMRSQFNWGSGSDTVFTTGLDLEITRASLLETQDRPIEGSAFLRETIPTGRHYDYDVDALSAGLFTSMSTVLPDERTELRLGLRLDHLAYDYDNQMLDGRTREDGTACGFGGCRFSRPADRSDSFTVPTLDIGLSRELGESQRVFARLARAFRAPQATELYRLQRDQQVADLNEEQLINLEAGIRGSTASLSYEAVAFWQRKKNVILRDSDFFNVSDGKTRHRGIELMLQRQMTPRLDLRAAFSYARHEYDNDPFGGDVPVSGNDVDTAPRTLGQLALEYRHRPSLSATLLWRHVGSYQTDPENLHSYPGHDLINMTVNWRIRPYLALTLGIDNLTDRRYADRADFSGFAGDRYFPGRPRSAFMELSWRP